MMRLDHEEPELRLALDEIVIDVRPRVGLAADVVRLGRRTRRRRRAAATLAAASMVGVGAWFSVGALDDGGSGMMIVRPAVDSPTATPSSEVTPSAAPTAKHHGPAATGPSVQTTAAALAPSTSTAPSHSSPPAPPAAPLSLEVRGPHTVYAGQLAEFKVFWRDGNGDYIGGGATWGDGNGGSAEKIVRCRDGMTTGDGPHSGMDAESYTYKKPGTYTVVFDAVSEGCHASYESVSTKWRVTVLPSPTASASPSPSASATPPSADGATTTASASPAPSVGVG